MSNLQLAVLSEANKNHEAVGDEGGDWKWGSTGG